jgi:hypothetical protein
MNRIDISKYNICHNNDGTILLKPIPKVYFRIINNISELDNFNFSNSTINSVYINGNYYNNCTKFRQILNQLYLIINNGATIIKKSILNISTLQLKDKGFYYIPQIGISVQGADSNKIMKEAYIQAIKLKIKLEIVINFNYKNNYIILKNF